MPEIVVEPVNLERFERLVYLNDGSLEASEAAVRELFAILGQLREGMAFYAPDATVQATLWTRLAGAITTFLTNPHIGVSPDGFVQFCAMHTQIHAIFRASAYETMDHILAVFGQRDAADPAQMTFSGDQSLLKLLMCWSLDSEIDLDFEAMARAVPGGAAAAMIGMLSVGGSHTKKSYARRLMLMRNRHLLDAYPMPPALIQAAGDCYMHCSYTDAPDKHEIKRTINRKMFETVGRNMPVQECTRVLQRKERPTIVIPIEWFGSAHAMYRCYAPSLLELKQRFRLVAVFRDSSFEIDAEGRKVFDKCVGIDPAVASIETLLAAIQGEEPDILYWPSLGMAAWYVALSNFLIAPIQIISPGHPASSMSPCIDYMVSDGDLFGDPHDYTERLAGLPTGTVRYIAMAGRQTPERPARDDGVVRVAIAAVAMKIIPPFLEALQRIQAGAKSKIEFHFFPNMVGMGHHCITKDLQRWFPDCVVHHRDQYANYAKELIGCDLALSTFPFGGTNSTIDCFLVGLPVLTLEGPHVHGRSDASMMRRVGLPDFLITHTVDEYVKEAVRLIDSQPERENLREFLKLTDVEKEFYGEGPQNLKGGFLAAFEKIYQEKLDEQERGISEGAGGDAGSGEPVPGVPA